MSIALGVTRHTTAVPARTLMFIAVSLAMLGNYYVYDSIAPVAELLSRQLGFSDLQIGSLNAIYSLPNIFMVLVGGVLIDRYGARAVAVSTAGVCLLGAVLTALGSYFPLMVCGRLLFGLGAETLLVAILAALAQWFFGRSHAFLLASGLSLARLGSYLADRSPSFAHDLYDIGWQPPLWLAVAFAALSFCGAVAYWIVSRRETERGDLTRTSRVERIDWRNLLRFRQEYWLLVGLCVTFYSVILPFRSTFAIKYFQHAHGLGLEEAGRMNSYVFMAAVFATPAFGWLVDQVRRHGPLMIVGSLVLPLSFVCLACDGVDLWIPTGMLGASYSLVPAVLWPSVVRHVSPEQLGTAYGLMAMLQNAGLTISNMFAGYLNDRSLASAANPHGYLLMLWFFGLLSLMGFVFAVLLTLRAGDRKPLPS